jgi:hypothetical protein
MGAQFVPMHAPFAIAVEWPDESRPFLVHLQKPYFVAEVRRRGDSVLFVSTLKTEQVRSECDTLSELLAAANQFFGDALGISGHTAQFLKGRHGREFPRFLMARTVLGDTYIVEPDHPSPLVEVKEPALNDKKPKLTPRFDVVTQWRLGQMRKYYQQFLQRQRECQSPALVVPAL